MSSARIRPLTLRVLAVAATLLALLGTNLTPRGVGDLQSQIDSSSSTATNLRSAIAAESARIDQTRGGLESAQHRLDGLQRQLQAREAQLADTQRSLLAARERLLRLENRMRAATAALATNLRAGYEGSRPDLVSVVLNAHGFSDLLEHISFLQRIGRQDAIIVWRTRTARAAVARQTAALARLERRDRSLATQVLGQRNQVATLHTALLRRQIAQLSARAGTASRLHSVDAKLASLRAQAAAQARRAAAAAAAASAASQGPAGGASGSGGASAGGIAVNAGGMVQPPGGAPGAVGQVIAAGNAIATLPYVWGGGHGSFHDSGYDCSGSVSYALAAGGLLSSPLDSTGFESWGEAGPGRWITVYANSGHAFMVVAGWRFDTVALSQGGTRWSQSMTDTSGFVERHPPGL